MTTALDDKQSKTKLCIQVPREANCTLGVEQFKVQVYLVCVQMTLRRVTYTGLVL